MTENQICVRCINDRTLPGIKFDEKGECNFCKAHDQLEREYPLDEKGKKKLESHIAAIKKAGRGKKYDCVTGVSGGRDSTYMLWLLKEWGLRPLAVHFNDGFGNPVAGQNMKRTCDKLGVEMRTITSDWRESKDLKIAFLKASTPDMEEGTDVGIATSLFGVAAKENIKHIVIGQSFRTEGICPLEWNYLDGRYLKSVHRMFGSVKLRPWKPDDPGFNLGLSHMLYYSFVRGIKVLPLLYYVPYDRAEASELITRELGWVYPGAHWFDDLYQALMARVLRTKFKVDRRRYNYSALVRSGQMPREEALARMEEIYVIEDPKVIDLCIKRLGLTHEEFEKIIAAPPKTFRDYPSNFRLIKLMKIPIYILSKLEIIPGSTYTKYFECG